MVKVKLAAVFSLSILFSQTAIAQTKDSTHHYIRNVVWTTPVSKTTTINGLAIGLMAEAWKNAAFLKINGLNIELEPFGLIALNYALFGTVSSAFNKTDTNKVTYDNPLMNKDIFPEKPTELGTTIKGISVSAGGLTGAGQVYGLCINGIISFPDAMQGMEITGVMNMHYEFKGLMIAGLRNKATTGKGVQIALINSCQKGKLVQFGLINRIGKRTTPILNFSL